jgi:hypothetical protein
MNCKKCGRPLKGNEDKLCPHCRNEQDEKIKTAAKVGIGVVAVLVAAGLGLLKILGGSKDGKS